jgi:hypothetical protein
VKDPALLEASIRKLLLDARRHLAALESAVAEFGPELDAAAFGAAWQSDQPGDMHRAYLIQAGYENLINAVIRASRELCELRGWLPADVEPSSIDVLRLLRENGVVDGQVRRKLEQAQEMWSGVQYDSANVEPGRRREAVMLVLEAAPQLIQDTALALRAY